MEPRLQLCVVQYLDAHYRSFTYLYANNGSPIAPIPPLSGCPAVLNLTANLYTIDCSAQQPYNSPRWSISPSFRQTVRIGAVTVTAVADTNYRSGATSASPFCSSSAWVRPGRAMRRSLPRSLAAARKSRFLSATSGKAHSGIHDLSPDQQCARRRHEHAAAGRDQGFTAVRLAGQPRGRTMISDTLSGAPRSITSSMSRSAASSQPLRHQFFGDFVIVDDPGRPVACKQEDVAFPDIARHDVDIQLLADSHCARDDIGIWMNARLGFAQHAGENELVHEAVIPAEMGDAPGADAIRSAVASPEAAELISGNRKPRRCFRSCGVGRRRGQARSIRN